MLRINTCLLAGLALQLLVSVIYFAPALSANLVQLWPKPDAMQNVSISKSVLSKLNSYDLVLLLDSSGSMNDKDCPAAGSHENVFLSKGFTKEECLTRWQWCAHELTELDKQTKGVLSEPLRVACFAKKTHNFSGLTFATVSQIFFYTSPKGNTDTTSAMKAELADFMQKRTQGEHQKPLMLVVLSDCCPDNKSSVKETLQKLSDSTKPNEVCVLFLQIGNDRNGEHFIAQLNREVQSGRIRSDVVRTISFTDLLQNGVGQVLIDAARAREELVSTGSPWK